MFPPPGCELYLDAFWTLNGGRQYASSMGGILPCGLPYRELRAFARDRGVRDPNTLRDFVTILQAMDGAFIEATTEKLNAKS